MPIEVSVYAGILWFKPHTPANNIKPAGKKSVIEKTPETVNILMH